MRVAVANTNVEKRRERKLAYYYRRKARDPLFMERKAEEMRVRRASMTPDERAAYLSKKAKRAREKMKVDPEYRARKLAGIRAAYAKRRDVEPEFMAEQSRRGYVRNVGWRLASEACRRAVRKGIPADLTREWVLARWTGRCEVTGIEFVLQRRGLNPYSPSIDRIDATKGYTQDNCRFVLMAVNGLKGTGTDDDMIAIARAIVRRSDG